jgi:mono/diheme cytochrome c family protein
MKRLLALTIWPVISLSLLFFGSVGCESGSGLSSSQMSPGEKLYRAKCASCHRLRDPKTQTDDEWPEYVEEYGKKLRAEDKALITSYLQANN